MDKNLTRTFLVSAVILLFAALVFLAAESRGRALESRFGLLAIFATAGLLFLAAWMKPKGK